LKGRKSKLTPLQKMALISAIDNGESKERVAVKFEVSVRTVDRILKASKEVNAERKE
jgi:DNA invertase Pin-like site-specific DNA recombinase